MTEIKLSSYLERLQILRDLNLLPAAIKRGSKKNPFAPKIVFLDTDQGVAEVGDAIAQGWPVVTDYGSTYGTAFPPLIRQEVALARGEKEPLETVSLVTFREVAYSWMDFQRIHPTIIKAIENHKLRILEGVAFMRFAANDLCVKAVGPNHINQLGEVQVFIVSHQDPLMAYLRRQHGINFIAVRSSNISGQKEEAFAHGAAKYASQIGAPLLAVRSLKSFSDQIEDERKLKQRLLSKLKRKRYGSQPIIRLPLVTEPSALTLVRSGNTHPVTMRALLAEILKEKIDLSFQPEKKTAFNRRQFQINRQIVQPTKIKKLLLKNSNLL